MYRVDFTCKECGKDFEAEWSFSDVECPHCKTLWRTDFDTDAEDSIQGPWLDEKVRVGRIDNSDINAILEELIQQAQVGGEGAGR